MHKTSGRSGVGFLLSLLAAVTWGSLPLALKILLADMDAWTLTWYRFMVAAVLLGGWLALRGKLPNPLQLRGHSRWLLLIALLGLCGNYVLYLLGLDYTTPAAAQIVIQLAPMFLLIGGLVVFGERFHPLQFVGVAVLWGGLFLFFSAQFQEIFTLGALGRGVGFVFLASLAWGSYALAQKQLLNSLPSSSILWLIYTAAIVVFLPTAAPALAADLDTVGLLLLAFCCLNTLVAYGSFAEALQHWDASRVSVVISTAPLFTLALVEVVEVLFPGLLPEQPLDWRTVGGAALVVGGSALTALAGARRHRRAPRSDR